jgi:hypothetical protein
MTKVAELAVVFRDGSSLAVEPNDQLFSFHPADKVGPMLIFVPKLVSLRAEHPDLWETIETPIVPADARMIDQTRGINHAQLRRMPRQRIDEPGIGVFLEDGSFLLVDGNHRYCKRANLGEKSMLFHVCSPPTWHAALVDLGATTQAWG